jgi:hypothetical protein
MIRPKETVESDGIIAVQIMQHPHRELDSDRQFSASGQTHQIPAR